MIKELRWASFVSGGGTTMNEMNLAIQREEVRGIKLGLVLSSDPEAGAISKALKAGVDPHSIVVVDPRNYKGEDGKVDQDGFGRQILMEMKKREIDFFTQNGWLPLTPARVIEEFEGFNQHPQRVPEFGGKGMHGIRPHAARLNYARIAGEVHPTAEPVAQRVSPEFDQGEVVVYRSVPIPPEMLSADIKNAAPALQKLVLSSEHAVQIELLHKVRWGTVRAQELPSLAMPTEGTIFDAAALARQQAKQQFPQA